MDHYHYKQHQQHQQQQQQPPQPQHHQQQQQQYHQYQHQSHRGAVGMVGGDAPRFVPVGSWEKQPYYPQTSNPLVDTVLRTALFEYRGEGGMPTAINARYDAGAGSSNTPNRWHQSRRSYSSQHYSQPAAVSTTAKIVMSGIPQHAKFDDIEPLLKPYGKVEHCEAGTSKDPNTQTVHITFQNHDQAQRAVSSLNGIEFDGSKLLVELSEVNKQARRTPRNRSQYGAGMPGGGGPGRQTDFPLRVLVQSEMVGAIIGRQGSTIRHITQQSRARVDVHRKDNVGSVEKAITIYGNPENCTMACKKILEVMQQEANSTNKGEICLKILAHNNLIGRIIGKSGNTIKRIMQDTDTKITVSSINDISSFNLERIITVKGTIENMSKGESQISAKLRQSYENDLQALAPQSIMFPGLHPMAMMSTAGNGMGFTGRTGGGGGGGVPAAPGGGAGGAGGMYPGSNFPMYQPPTGGPATGGVPPGGSSEVQETTYLYIPNNAVGAIIGTKGLHIRNIIRFSGASVKIAPLEADKPQEQQTERKVTIIGTPEAQWKAQYLIFEKMREEGFVSGTDDVRLTVEIFVPSAQVGRIIGKGGQNVRELQRVTGSIIKLPEHTANTPVDEETTVHIIGPFFSVQSAQRRIRTMMQATNPPPVTKRQSTQKAKEQSGTTPTATTVPAVGGDAGVGVAAPTTPPAGATGATTPTAVNAPSTTPPQQQQQQQPESSSTSA
ncbi:insulin-like growth factor 2 mRNA-binding protein 1 isoform X1 [Anopheles albimanus]|uniref:insulin-like growth factor 2 mRNA-binding protein 1 isoform X1 n=1 Tax=Anopheles albimanus TaxID=7167 RepID=UPI00163F7CA5|nr:insulin-like growth factor 2 mRNA-binding protein 1 isoform X1 [Anopheles albimanus]